MQRCCNCVLTCIAELKYQDVRPVPSLVDEAGHICQKLHLSDIIMQALVLWAAGGRGGWGHPPPGHFAIRGLKRALLHLCRPGF